jgi:hypothetical protein
LGTEPAKTLSEVEADVETGAGSLIDVSFSIGCTSLRTRAILRRRERFAEYDNGLGMAFMVGAALSGCAVPILGAALAAQGTTAAVALSLGPLDALRDSTASDQCRVLAQKGISVSETLEIGVPANEGQAVMFEPAWWRPEFAREGYPQVERSRAPREGILAIGDRSLTFVPPAGAVSVRVPTISCGASKCAAMPPARQCRSSSDRATAASTSSRFSAGQGPIQR